MKDIVAEKSNVTAVLDKEPVPKRIGLIALATDHTSERDFAQLIDPDEAVLYVNRIEYENPTTAENLKKTGPRLTKAVADLLPDEYFDVVAYSCTAASVVLGNPAVEEFMQAGKTGLSCVTPSSAAFKAFKTLGKRKISVLTPYTPAVTIELVDYFQANGLDVLNAECFGLEDDRNMARISHQSIIEAVIAATSPEAEALFISCTAVRALDCIDAIEAKIKKPVISSNQAVIWDCFRQANITRKIAGYGQLFSNH